MVAMRDNWLGMPGPEVGLTVGYQVAPHFSIELTGSARKVEDNDQPLVVRDGARPRGLGREPDRPARADGRGRTVRRAWPPRSRHRSVRPRRAGLSSTGTRPASRFWPAGARTSRSRARRTSHRRGPRCPDSGGDAFVPCIDFGPDAEEIHAGDVTGQMRLAFGWQF